MYGTLSHGVREDVVHDIIRGAVEADCRLILDARSCDLIGKNSDLMFKYIGSFANRLILVMRTPVEVGTPQVSLKCTCPNCCGFLISCQEVYKFRSGFPDKC